jgi:hypothetical protein
VHKLREAFKEPQLEAPMAASRNTTRVKREEDEEDEQRKFEEVLR